MTLALSVRRCFSAAVGLGTEDASRFVELHDLYVADGMASPEAAQRAAADLVAELQDESSQIDSALASLGAAPATAETTASNVVEKEEVAAPAPMPPEPEPTTLADRRRVAAESRELEREIFNSMTADASLIGADLVQVTEAVTRRLPDGEARAAALLADPARIEKLAKAVHRTLASKAKALAKQKHRDPAVLESAIRDALPPEPVRGPLYDAAGVSAFRGGFQHALAGKTKSTLAGDMLVQQQAGYAAAKDWIQTEEGAAWYEGRPVNKLVNTGIDLRRHWEQLREQMKAGESDVAKAWKGIERATARADLFAPLAPEGASPGFKLYVETVRGNTLTFGQWLDRLDWGGEAYYRSRYSDSKPNTTLIQEGDRYPRWLSQEDRDLFQTDTGYRIKVLQDLARTYQDNVRGFIGGFLEGKSSVREASDAFRAQHFNENPPLKVRTESRALIFSGHKADQRLVWGGRLSEFEALAESRWLEDLIKNEASITLPTKGTPLVPPRLDRVTRKGLTTDARMGNNVTPQQFKDTFGFADVGFGKWVGSRQDQDHLNYATDAFADLANHFGTSVKNIGFGGQLHFTIGALGHGKHAAHFWSAQPHPDGGKVQVINLTNTKGDGAVYHEWLHALDHNLGGEWPQVRLQLLDHLKTGTRTPEDVEQRARDFLFGGWYFKGDKRQPKVDAAVQGVRHGLRPKTSAFKTNADALGKDYWGNDHELIARAGEAWAADTLGGVNDYLVNPEWVGDGKVTKEQGRRGTPYPTGDERKLFNQVYGALAKAVKWKDGKPTVSVADFRAALPAEVTAWVKRRDELLAPGGMQRFFQEENIKREQAVAEKAAEKRMAAEIEQQRLDELAAQKLAALQPPVLVDGPPAGDTQGPLNDDDLSAIFDEAAAELREQTQEQPNVPPPGAQVVVVDKPPPGGWTDADKVPAKDRSKESASKLIAEAAKLGVQGAEEALTGLAKLFGGGAGRLNSFGAGFDEDTYQKAKPHFKAALASFQAAGKSLKDLFKLLIQQFGDGIKEYAVRFAKDEGLTAQLGATPTLSASQQVAKWVQGNLNLRREMSWRELFEQADRAFGGTQAQGKYSPKDAYDAAEAGMNAWIMANPAFTPAMDAERAQFAVKQLEGVTSMLPTQTKRTAEQDEYQQFSTVPPLAFLANWVANVGTGDTMLEPSAGIGGLAAFARNGGAKVVLNELSSRRAALLQEVFPGTRVFRENAEQIDNVLPDDVQPTVVVMNPPFSATAGRMQGARDTNVGALHVKQALARLVPGGRLVAIVGKGMAMGEPAFAGFWRDMQAKYDVRAAVVMDGSGYAKYGTTFDNLLLVIDKRAPRGVDVVSGRVQAYTDLVPLLAGIREDRPRANAPANDRDGAELDAAESARQDAADRGEGAGTGRQPGAGEPAGVGGDQPVRQPDDGRDGAGRGGEGGAGRSASRSRQPGGRPDAAGRDGAGSGAAAGQPDGGPAGRPLDQQQQSGVTVQSGQAQAATLTDSVFETYHPQRLQVPGAQPHPGALVQSAAMASVLPPAVTYTPNLPREAITEGKLSIAQIESVVYAGQAHEQMLDAVVGTKAKGKVSSEQRYRRGFFIGDGTGVGKGREISGIILDNMRQGRKRAVWVSEKQGLMNDAKRDFEGVGGDPAIIFNQNETKAEGEIPSRNGILFTTYSTMRSGAQSQAAGKGLTGPALLKAFPPGTKVKAVAGMRQANYEVERFDLKNKLVYVTNLDTGREGIKAKFDQVESIDGITDWQKGRPSDKAAAKKEGQSRFDQLVAWLGDDYDGVIVFDEAHAAGNALTMKGERGETQPSAQALAVVDLQDRLPNARIVYVSATGATKVENLGYATRLGLWGEGTSFPTVESFVSQMEAGGLATMELVARDMKQMGAYMARSLSFDGVSYSRVEHQLTDTQRAIYDRLADAWQVTLQNFMEALEATGVTSNGKTLDGRTLAAAKSAYWGAQQRFFNQIITSMQMPSVLEAIEGDLAQGRAVVLQLVNTNEASQDRAVKARKEAGEESLEDLDLTPRDQLLQMVEKSFPTVQHEKYTDDNGNLRSQPAVDSEGKPVINREAVKMRDALIADLKQITVPQGPLEIILNQFGPDAVAEVTGRTQRVVRRTDDAGNQKMVLEPRSTAKARADADDFMADKKQILIFSDAGGTGFSFQADLSKKNQRKRSHYLLQPGWRADKAVQGFGRTHRTNQASAPEYRLASTDIPAHKRFLSSIARRLDQLGALTKGQRDTANQGLFSEKDNLESGYARGAVRTLFDDMRNSAVPGMKFGEFLRQMGLENIVDPRTNAIAEDKYPPVSQFLNRLLSLRLDMQRQVFDAFIQRMEAAIEMAAQRGQLDTGMQTIRALESRVLRDEKVYTDPRTGAETRYVELELTMPNTMYQPPVERELADGESKTRWAVNKKSGKVFAITPSGSTTKKDGSVVRNFRLQGTNGSQYRDDTEISKDQFRQIERAEGVELWAKENEARPKTYKKNAHMIVGALLPIWDRIKTDGLIQVARTQTVDGQRLLGRVVNEKDVRDVLKRLNVDSGLASLAPAEVLARLLRGDKAELANGWRLERARVSDDLRIELKAGYTGRAVADELARIGVIHERIQWNDRYFVPVDRPDVMAALLKNRPLVELGKPSDDDAALATTGHFKARAFWSGTPFDKGEASPNQARADAIDVLGFDPGVPVLRENRPEAKTTPMRYDLATRTVLYNTAVPHTRALDVQYMVEELLHALDHVGGDRLLSAASSRLAPGGDIRAEIEAAAGKSAAMKGFFYYPLQVGGMSPDRIAAELFARIGVVYHGFPELLQTTAPNVFAVYAGLLGRPSRDRGVPGQVRPGQPGAGDVQVRGEQLGGGRAAEGAGQGGAVFNALRLQRLRAGAGRALSASAQGAPFKGADLETRTAGDTLAGSLNNARDLRLFAGYRVGDLLDTDGKLSWWHKTVGTMHNLAQRSAPFRRVYDAARQFIDDTSFYATEAADLAPRLLPKLETWRDITKSPISAEDSAAIRAPIFEGTLTWARDDRGNAVRVADLERSSDTMSAEGKAREMFRRGLITEQVLKMWQGLPIEQYEAAVNTRYSNEVLKPGVVFTDAELKQHFKLTAGQVKLYREFRAATDRSLTNMAISDMLRYGGQDVATLRERALASGSADQAAIVLRDHLYRMAEENPDRATVLNDAADTIVKKGDRATDLIRRGYAPLMRFGQYTLDVVDEDGQRVYFSLFESAAERSKMARQMRANFPKAQISTGTVSEQEFQMFAGVNPETVELFGEMLGLESQGQGAANEAFQTYLKRAKAQRSSMKRLIERKGIAGFAEDAGRVLAGFVYSNARQTAGNLHTGELVDAVEAIPQGEGQLKDAAVQLYQYVRNPIEEAQKVRGLLFAQYLGGSVASAMVNALQPVQVTFPYLSQYTSIGNAANHMRRAMADALKRTTGDAALDKALHAASEKGIVSPQEVHQLIGQAAGKATLRSGDGTRLGDLTAEASNLLSRVQLAWGKVFGVAEQFNRRSTFIAAYRIAVEKDMADPAAFAEKAVNDTQFVYTKANRPRWARGAVGSVLFTFKTYSINYVELLHRMATQGGPEGKKAALLALGVLFLMAGASGLPGSDDLDDLIDGLLQRLGYNFQSKAAKQRFFAETLGLGDAGSRFIEHGLSGLPGSPLDVSGRLGLGNLIPGTRLFTKKQDYGRDVAEIAGPFGDLTKRFFEGAGKAVTGDLPGAARSVFPVAAQNLVKAIDMAASGRYKDERGRKVIDTDAVDAAFKSVGFQPSAVARVQEAARTANVMVQLNKLREAEIADAWAKGIAENDKDAIAKAQADVQAWNRSNPESPITITRQQIRQRVQTLNMSRAERLERTAPKEIRAEVRRQLGGEGASP
jgi:polyhydroxyalkanoate synthesis regulator phasin/cation transport regulator ChaB